jgi:hypothetical protein
VSFGSCGMLIVVESMAASFVPDMMSQLCSDQPMYDLEPRNLSAETTRRSEINAPIIPVGFGRVFRKIKYKQCSANQMAIIPLSVSKIGRSGKDDMYLLVGAEG